MQIDSEDRYIDETREGGFPRLPIALLLLAVIIGATWYFTPTDPEPEPTPDIVTPVPAESPPPLEAPPAPDIPEPVVEETPDPEPEAAPAPPPPPPEPPLTLEQSDPEVRLVVTDALGDTVFAQSLQEDNLLERGAALFDAAGNGAVLREVFPVPGPEGKFAVIDRGGILTTDPASYQRYDRYAAAIAALDTDTLAAAFHRFRPLLEQAYANLGYAADDMDNSLIRALNEVIAAPVLSEPAVLVRHVNTYTYEDQALEDLSPLAKQLLRMGPENQAVIQGQARALRSALLGQ